jgi:hypothetical protein
MAPEKTRLLWLTLAAGLGACGGEEPPPLPVLSMVDVLVQDDFLSKQECTQLASLELRGRVAISGVAATCRLTINQDGTVLSICGDVPGLRARDFTIDYIAKDAVGELVLVQTAESLDLTAETRSRVPLDLSKNRSRVLADEDRDGASNLEEFCAGTDPRS